MIDVGSGVNLLGQGVTREEFIISSAEALHTTEVSEILQSKEILLNGNLLRVLEEQVPPLYPKVVRDSDSIVLDRLTYGFVVFPDADIGVCN
jgi:hypothetical protein